MAQIGIRFSVKTLGMFEGGNRLLMASIRDDDALFKAVSGAAAGGMSTVIHTSGIDDNGYRELVPVAVILSPAAYIDLLKRARLGDPPAATE